MSRLPSEPLSDTAEPPKYSYTCAEQREVAETGSLEPYLRADDPMCRAFLENGRDPAQFRGIKSLFPFIRTGSVYAMPRSLGVVHHWMAFAFAAGYDYGRAHPDELEAVLPREQEREALRRVGVLKQALSDERVSNRNLKEGFERIVEDNRQHYQGHSIHEVLAELVLRALRTGFAAATVAQTDPQLSEFLADLPECTSSQLRSAMSRTWILAPRRVHGRSPVEQLDHPLVSMTRELHWERPTEQACMLEAVRDALAEMETPGEDYCPGCPYNLIAWIDKAMAHGTRIQRQTPQRVEQILTGYSAEHGQGVVKMVRDIVKAARGPDAARLLGPMMMWQQDVHKWTRADCHGERVGLVTHMVDFAIWVPGQSRVPQNLNAAEQTRQHNRNLPARNPTEPTGTPETNKHENLRIHRL